MSIWKALITRELILKARSPAQWLYPILFYVLVLVLFPLAAGTESAFLSKVGVAAIWIAATLSVLLGMDGLFASDIDDGTLEQLMVAHVSMPLWALLKTTIHWFSGGLVMTLLCVLAVPMFHVDTTVIGLLLITLLLGTPSLCLFAATAAALTVSLRGQSILLPLIAIPLQLPVLIFATGAVNLALTSGDPKPILALLAAILIFSVVCLPFAMAFALKMAVAE